MVSRGEIEALTAKQQAGRCMGSGWESGRSAQPIGCYAGAGHGRHAKGLGTGREGAGLNHAEDDEAFRLVGGVGAAADRSG